ncbi:GNAT family N-acetyltransferase [Aspergillus thermomutatus]|uniref:N-acetyltransferase domain-containing protein n=1 Tax=Aspergillus thermomutatus TaxID=41047 RepID=A0A397H4P6_ASPTH|nr:uncharacterized protein CDV56_105589 [Aspergillus thermomutatus]RHZ57997.1 hypothetical protein CDV56_105589 [Aspergillus thermomutatus]
MQTSRLELVRLTEDHLPGYFSMWKDPEATKWSSHGPCNTLEAAKKWMSELLPEVNPMGENYAVLLRHDLDPDVIEALKRKREHSRLSSDYIAPGVFLGWIGTWKSDPVPELGFIFHRDTWGLGFASEALTAFKEVFWQARPEFDVLEAWCDTENTASANVLRKCGFDSVEVAYGDYHLPGMTPPLRNSERFRLGRPTTGYFN